MHYRRICTALLALVLYTPAVQAADTLYDERFKRWTQQAEAGDPIAQYKLGNAYMRGLEVTRDHKRAAEWFAKAAAQGEAKAQYKLGYLYFEGKGVTRDYDKAYKLLREAAQQDYSPAQFYLGRCYAEGLGTEQDNRKALYWFNQAANDNYTPAKKEVERIRALVAAEKEAAEADRQAREAAAARQAAGAGRPQDPLSQWQLAQRGRHAFQAHAVGADQMRSRRRVGDLQDGSPAAQQRVRAYRLHGGSQVRPLQRRRRVHGKLSGERPVRASRRPRRPESRRGRRAQHRLEGAHGNQVQVRGQEDTRLRQ